MRISAICLSIAVFFVAVLSISTGYAENLRVMLHCGSFPPYYFVDDKVNTGIVKDIFNAFAAETGDTIEFVRCPFNRSQYEFERGKIDIEPMSNPKWRQFSKVPGVYSKSFAVSDSIVLFARDAVVSTASPEELLGKVIGTVRGYYYPVFSPYFEDGRMVSHMLENENKLIELLLGGRLDQALMNKDFALYQIKNRNLGDRLIVSKPYDSLDMMIRFHPSKKDAVPRFNKAIDKLLSDGTIKKIYDSYR